jgi:type IV pilus assembly protein PilW
MTSRVKGLSLVELMISLLLGSLVTIAATQMFLVNRQTENLQLGIASIQDSGRFAFDYLSRDLMQSGFTEAGEPSVPFAVSGFGGHVIADGMPYDQMVAVVDGGNDCVGSGDFSGIKKWYVKTDAKGKRIICTVYELDSGNWVADDKGPLIDNVEAFQVLYGLDFDSSTEQDYLYPDLYVNATQLQTLDTNDTDYRIVSVRFSILISSDGVVSVDDSFAPSTIQVLDQTFTQGADPSVGEINFKDGRLYRVYTSTVALRNVVDEL